jgi:hypothetical protein
MRNRAIERTIPVINLIYQQLVFELNFFKHNSTSDALLLYCNSFQFIKP